MKFFERLKIWGKKKGEQVFKVDELDKALKVKEDLMANVESFKKAAATAAGERDAIAEQLEGYKEQIKKLDDAFAYHAKKGDRAACQKIDAEKQKVSTKLKAKEAVFALKKDAAEKLKTRKETAELNLGKIDARIEAIKSKEMYAKEVNKYTDLMSKTNTTGANLDEIEYNVNVEFNAAEFKMQELDEETSVENLLNVAEVDSDFEARFRAAAGLIDEPAEDKDRPSLQIEKEVINTDKN